MQSNAILVSSLFGACELELRRFLRRILCRCPRHHLYRATSIAQECILLPHVCCTEGTDAATERLVEEWKSEYRDKARTAALAEAQRLAHEREATAAMLAAQPASLAAELLRACGGVTEGAAGAPARQRARASTPPSPRAGMQHLPWSAAAERQRRAATPPPRV